MSLKRRDLIAYVLILIAALGWTIGQYMLSNPYGDIDETTVTATMVPIEATTFPTEEGYVPTTTVIKDEIPSPTEPYEPNFNGEEIAGFTLSFAGIAAMIVSVFVICQKAPVLGPDGVALLAALASAYYTYWIFENNERNPVLYYIFIVLELICCREILGWIRVRLSLNWCAVSRLSKRCPLAQMALLVYVIWIVGSVIGVAAFRIRFPSHLYYNPAYLSAEAGLVATGIFGLLCLWKYGSDLQHFKTQLNNFQSGNSISVRDGAFSQTELQLMQVQQQHEQAIQTAVTSERFKVELIANVSHDLRTPLTSILGYGELLEKEGLSPTGQEQLSRLNQKAGYMRELVESLFELTKVSSGVVESKKEQIDLIRLLEQTVGLFDDQLNEANLLVRRHYDAESMGVVTDGARMHQVFANLLGNAIKYALPSTRIHLQAMENADSYTVRMSNISSYEMDFQPDEIMQRFARGDKARSTKGSGLGLAIAQTYTESVGGTFRVSVDGDQFSAIVELPKTERDL